MVGTSPQHMGLRRRLRPHKGQSPLSVIDVLRISDDRALKVAGAYPGRPVASRKLSLLKT